MHFSAIAVALVSAVLAVSALPLDVAAADNITTRGLPLWKEPSSFPTPSTPKSSTPEQSYISIDIRCTEESGADMTNDIKSWVEDLLSKREVNQALGLSGRRHVVSVLNPPCHLDARVHILQYRMIQSNEGPCHAHPGCDGMFSVESTAVNAFLMGSTGENLFHGNL